jgi:uracil-DNA glycosylase
MGVAMDDMPFKLEPSWQAVLAEELRQPYLYDLATFVAGERLAAPIYPPESLVFNAFWHTPYDQVKVVIVGQDPYHGAGQAHGLSFSVPRDVPPPPSLKNIYKEIRDDLGIDPPSHGCLLSWAQQGVLLLNATLTVRQGVPMSHHGRGWERFTDAVIHKLCERPKPVIFVLWGKSAQEKCKQIAPLAAQRGHVILTSPHPSPFSAHQGFFGSKPFSKINQLLIKQGQAPIDWCRELVGAAGSLDTFY